MIIIAEKINGSIPSVAKAIAEKDEAFALHVPGIPEDVSKDAKLAAALSAVADECARLGVKFDAPSR